MQTPGSVAVNLHARSRLSQFSGCKLGKENSPMKSLLSKVAVLAAVMTVAAEIPAGAQAPPPPAAVTLPATGTFAKGGEFTGTITINRFEQDDNHIVAIGVVRGVLRRGGLTMGSAVAGEVRWPVAVRVGGQWLASGAARKPGAPMPVAWSPNARSEFGVLRVQAETCQVVDLALGPVNVDVLGVQIALSPITFNLSGVSGTPLGDLVCAVSGLLGNVAGLVNLLNSVLGLLTGLLGGLTGGIGGV
jgi:hypothetical protein